ncbi:hypothetical protein [Kutzneria albida]|uniref:hypothetical protein n=1 Tax=Kutzneria albida TaxID=43357 RepID=UPI0004AE6E59|nr:hypothetical protein [Kutzneria albida]
MAVAVDALSDAEWFVLNAAVHEAGHLVACIAQGLPVVFARVERYGTSANAVRGLVRVDDAFLDSDPLGAVVVGVAGVAAEVAWLCRENSMGRSAARRYVGGAGCEADLRLVRKYLPRAGVGESVARELAERVVRERWGAVLRLGEALAARGWLDGGRVAALVR